MKLNTAIFLILLMHNIKVNSVVINCRMLVNIKWCCDLGTLYTCAVDNRNDFIGENVIVDGAIGSFQSGKNISSIQAFRLLNAKNLTRIPSNLNDVFPSLVYLQIIDCGLTELTQDDLKPFKNLKYLGLSENKIKILYADTFTANPNLEAIWLHENQIFHIDKFTFSHLNKLRWLYLDGNDNCSSLQNAETRIEVKNLIKLIEYGECQSIDDDY